MENNNVAAERPLFFLGNLPSNALESEVREFLAAESIEDVDVNISRQTKPPYQSCGYGFISFANEIMAAEALERLNERYFKGRRLKLKPALRQPTQQDFKKTDILKISAGITENKTFPNNLSFENVVEMHQYRSNILNVESKTCDIFETSSCDGANYRELPRPCKVVPIQETTKHVMASPPSTSSIISFGPPPPSSPSRTRGLSQPSTTNTPFDDEMQATEQDEPEPHNARTLFVGDLPRSASEAVLESIFSVFGAVEEVKIMRRKGSEPCGYGFITFSDSAVALRAMKVLDGSYLHGRRLRISGAVRGRSSKDMQLWKDGASNCFDRVPSSSALQGSHANVSSQQREVLGYSGRHQSHLTTDPSIGASYDAPSTSRSYPCADADSLASIPPSMPSLISRVSLYARFETAGLSGAFSPSPSSSSHLSLPSSSIASAGKTTQQPAAPAAFFIDEQYLWHCFSAFGPVIEVVIRESSTNKATAVQYGYAFIHYTESVEGALAAFAAVQGINNFHSDVRVRLSCEPSRTLLKYSSRMEADDGTYASSSSPRSATSTPATTSACGSTALFSASSGASSTATTSFSRASSYDQQRNDFANHGSMGKTTDFSDIALTLSPSEPSSSPFYHGAAASSSTVVPLMRFESLPVASTVYPHASSHSHCHPHPMSSSDKNQAGVGVMSPLPLALPPVASSSQDNGAGPISPRTALSLMLGIRRETAKQDDKEQERAACTVVAHPLVETSAIATATISTATNFETSAAVYHPPSSSQETPLSQSLSQMPSHPQSYIMVDSNGYGQLVYDTTSPAASVNVGVSANVSAIPTDSYAYGPAVYPYSQQQLPQPQQQQPYPYHDYGYAQAMSHHPHILMTSKEEAPHSSHHPSHTGSGSPVAVAVAVATTTGMPQQAAQGQGQVHMMTHGGTQYYQAYLPSPHPYEPDALNVGSPKSIATGHHFTHPSNASQHPHHYGQNQSNTLPQAQPQLQVQGSHNPVHYQQQHQSFTHMMAMAPQAQAQAQMMNHLPMAFYMPSPNSPAGAAYAYPYPMGPSYQPHHQHPHPHATILYHQQPQPSLC